jgi:hypothetical protein
MSSVVTRCARQAKRSFPAKSSSLKSEKRRAHRANRRRVHEYTAALVAGRMKQAERLEGELDCSRLTGWEVS